MSREKIVISEICNIRGFPIREDGIPSKFYDILFEEDVTVRTRKSYDVYLTENLAMPIINSIIFNENIFNYCDFHKINESRTNAPEQNDALAEEQNKVEYYCWDCHKDICNVCHGADVECIKMEHDVTEKFKIIMSDIYYCDHCHCQEYAGVDQLAIIIGQTSPCRTTYCESCGKDYPYVAKKYVKVFNKFRFGILTYWVLWETTSKCIGEYQPEHQLKHEETDSRSSMLRSKMNIWRNVDVNSKFCGRYAVEYFNTYNEMSMIMLVPEKYKSVSEITAYGIDLFMERQYDIHIETD